ncbi:MAG: hypothetical protein HC771_12045 [Synechococcales cyanobacterium CRU_2_2]|nr:hypothetical protein [Synechococcales cyanobacterium CRU_2_2]
MTNQPKTQQRLVIENLDTFQDLTPEAALPVQGGGIFPRFDDLGGFRRLIRSFPIKPIKSIKPLPPIDCFPLPHPMPLPHPLPVTPVVPVCDLDPHGPLPWCAVIL